MKPTMVPRPLVQTWLGLAPPVPLSAEEPTLPNVKWGRPNKQLA
jgi:hypothetical protein